METASRLIHGTTYMVAKLGARDGFRVLTKVTALVGATLKTLPADVKLSQLGSAGVSGLGGMLAAIAGGLADEWPTIELLCKGAHRTNDNGTMVPMPSPDVQFAGRYEDLAEFVEFALEVNFLGFFTALASRVGIARTPLTPSGSDSPPA